MTGRTLAGLSLGLAMMASAPARADWVTTWSAAPLPPSAAMGPMPATPSFRDRTIRQTLRISAGGTAVRIRLTNAFGAAPLAIGGARVAVLGGDGQEVAGTSHALRFSGAASAMIAKGAPLLSDPVTMAVPPLGKLSLSLYLPGDTGACTCHTTGLDVADVSAPGDHSAAPFKAESTLQMRAFVADVEVDAAKGARTVAVLGDSISDGVGSTLRANHRWPDLLAERLLARKGSTWAVANQGISGNRILNQGFGESALARFDRDILALPGVGVVIVFEGVNDLGIEFRRPAGGPLAATSTALGGTHIDAAQMIAGYRQIIARAHAAHVKVIGATIAPYKGASYWSDEGEQARQEINRFIREGGAFDGVVDFDKAVRDPADPASMRADFHIGDHLHGNDAAYRAIADSIDLRPFGH